VGIHLALYDADDERGAARADASGRVARADADAVRALIASTDAGMSRPPIALFNRPFLIELSSAPARMPHPPFALVLWIIIAIVAAAAGRWCPFRAGAEGRPDQAVETLFQARCPIRLVRSRSVEISRQDSGGQFLGALVRPLRRGNARTDRAARRICAPQRGIRRHRHRFGQQYPGFLKKVPVAYPLTVAGFAGTELSRTFGNTQGGLPFTVVITPDGTVKYRKMGRVHADELRAVLPGA
jgi:hypothetical protein